MGATPMLYDQLEYKMAGAMQGEPYRVTQTDKGLDVPWGSEYVLEGGSSRGNAKSRAPSVSSPGTTRVATSTR